MPHEQTVFTKGDRKMLEEVHAALVGSTDGSRVGINTRLDRLEQWRAQSNHRANVTIGAVISLAVKTAWDVLSTKG